MFQENIIVSNSGKPINFIPSSAIAVSKSDTTRFDPGLLYVGVGGDVTAIPAGLSTTVVFKNVPDGSFLPIYVIAVYNATTATDMLICY